MNLADLPPAKMVNVPPFARDGHGREMRRDPVAFYQRVSLQALTARLCDDGSHWWPWTRPFTWYFTAHPAELEHILVTGSPNFVKGELNRPFARMLGHGLLTSDGGLWQEQRRRLQPVFRLDGVPAMMPPVEAACERMLESWREAARREERIDLMSALAVLTMDIVWRVFLGRVLQIPELQKLHHWLHIALAYVTDCSFGPRRLPEWIRTRADRRFARAMDAVDAFIAPVVDHVEAGVPFQDALHRANGGHGASAMSRDQRRDEIVTVLHAGQNTLASALTWTLLLLSRHPAERSAVVQEARQGKGCATSVEEANTSATGRCLLEALRLFPPAWGGVRETKDKDTLGGEAIPPGSLVVFSQFAMHRHPALWPEPERYRPARFLQSSALLRGSYHYLPFGAGPRRCIGEHFALLAAHTILHRLHREFEVEIDFDGPLRYVPLLDLEPKGPLRARLSMTA